MKISIKELAKRARVRMLGKEPEEDIKIIEEDEEEFIKKVRKVLNDEGNNFAPLRALMDEKKLLKLDPCGRERYLLEITEKYLRAKAIIEREKLKNLA